MTDLAPAATCEPATRKRTADDVPVAQPSAEALPSRAAVAADAARAAARAASAAYSAAALAEQVETAAAWLAVRAAARGEAGVAPSLRACTLVLATVARSSQSSVRSSKVDDATNVSVDTPRARRLVGVLCTPLSSPDVAAEVARPSAEHARLVAGGAGDDGDRWPGAAYLDALYRATGAPDYSTSELFSHEAVSNHQPALALLFSCPPLFAVAARLVME